MSRIDISVHFSTSLGSIGAGMFQELGQVVFRGETIREAAVACILVTDEEIARLNETWVGHEGPTDVITFPLAEGELLEGEVYISVETARIQAKEYRTSLRQELARLWIHGLLHLCGHEDSSDEKRTAMAKREDLYLKKGGIMGSSGKLT